MRDAQAPDSARLYGREAPGRIAASCRRTRLAYEQGTAIQDESGDTGHWRDQDEVCHEVHAAYPAGALVDHGHTTHRAVQRAWPLVGTSWLHRVPREIWRQVWNK